MLSWSVRLRECFATSLTAYLFLCQTSASLEAKRRAMEAVDLRLQSRWLEVRWFSSTKDLAPRQRCKLTRILFCSTFSFSHRPVVWCDGGGEHDSLRPGTSAGALTASRAGGPRPETRTWPHSRCCWATRGSCCRACTRRRCATRAHAYTSVRLLTHSL